MNDILKKHCRPEFEQFWFKPENTNLSDRELTFVNKNRMRLLEESTESEIAVAEFLDENNVDFFPQFPIHCGKIHTTFWADFFIPKCKIVLEVDGSAHRTLYCRRKDAYRDGFMREQGYQVVRITNSDVSSGKYKKLLHDIVANSKKRVKNPTILSAQDKPYIKKEKLVREDLELIEKAIGAFDGEAMCFTTYDRYIISIMTTHLDSNNPIYEDVKRIKSMASDKGITLYWKFVTKNANAWMGRHLNNNTTKQHIAAVRAGAPEFKLK
jgi:very-short-patch-repair endonuclease